jgi:hypothetical protein
MLPGWRVSEVAPWAIQLKVTGEPERMVVSFAVKVSVGGAST